LHHWSSLNHPKFLKQGLLVLQVIFSNFMHRPFFQFLLHPIICLCFENLSACVALLMWNWTGMLLVLAYNCNLRANLVYKPTSAPINSYQVNSTLFFFFKTNTRTSRNIYKIIKLFFWTDVVDLGLIPLISNNSPAIPYFMVKYSFFMVWQCVGWKFQSYKKLIFI